MRGGLVRSWRRLLCLDRLGQCEPPTAAGARPSRQQASRGGAGRTAPRGVCAGRNARYGVAALIRYRPTMGLVAALTAIVCAATAQARPLPGVETRADRAAWHSLLRWPAKCERSWAKTGGSGAGIEKGPAEHGLHLVAVRCFVGAYQGVSMLYLVPAQGRPASAL